MVATYDETRFQQLPTAEEWEKIKTDFESKNGKIILIDKTHWFNLLTRCKGPVNNIPIYAPQDTSSRPYAISEIIYQEVRTPEEIKKEVGIDYDDIDDYDYEYSEENPKVGLVDRKHWVFNQDYSHQNISSSSDWYTLRIETKTIKDDYVYTTKQYRIKFYSICSPITMHHLYSKDPNEITLIFKGQLMGQNGNSPYRTVESVANNYFDKALRDSRNGFIKRTAPIIQLISKLTINDLTNSDSARETLSKIKLPKNDSEVLVKLIENNNYVVVNKLELPELEEKKKLSCYYPILTYEQCKGILDDLPKIDVEFACFGLGSAGTGILSQVGRSNWFSKYLLCDFDTVEIKNLRNQWYQTGDVSMTKVVASQSLLKKLSRQQREIIAKYNKFQDINMDSFKFKYVVSGFDSIDARLEFLNTFTNGTSTSKYLIDTRYDELTASIFFIDLEDEAQVEYYHKGLVSDKEAFDALREKNIQRITSQDEFIEYLDHNNIFYANCASMCRKLQKTYEETIPAEQRTTETDLIFDRGHGCCNHCRSTECLNFFKKMYEEFPQLIHDNFYIEKKEESSCLRENFIDIYDFASSFVFATIRQIESDEPKPFTHVEVQTENIPSMMVLRK